MILIRKSGIAHFNDKRHLDNFVKYLTRSDWSQKWTNELTKNCLFAVRSSDGQLKELKISDGKEKLSSAISIALLGLSPTDVGNDIYSVGEYHGSEDDEVIDDTLMDSLDQETCEEAFSSLMEEMDGDDTVLVMAMHNDQDYGGGRIDNHIHRIVRL